MNFFSSQNVLALPSTDVPLVYQHPMSHMVTSLPYVDEENDSQLMSQVQKLIQEEMKIMPKKDYLANLRLKESKFDQGRFLPGEFDRVKKGIMLDSIDITKYKAEEYLPPAKENDLSAIKEAITKAEGLSQHNNFKMINLELLNKYGPAVWKDYLTEAESFTKKKEKEAVSVKYAIDEINAKRKFDQLQTKDKMNEYNEKIYYMLYKNQALEMECEAIENEIKDIRLKKLKKI